MELKKLLLQLVAENISLQHDYVRPILEKCYNNDVKALQVILYQCINKDKIGEEQIPINLMSNLSELLKEGFYPNKSTNLIHALSILLHIISIERNIDLDIINDKLDEYEKTYGWNHIDTFLLPCDLFGCYSISLLIRLMKSKVLIKYKNNEYQRYKHILEKQIFITNDKAIDNYIFKLLVDVNNNINLNLYTGDILSYNFDNIFGITKFNTIFCNPPYTTNTVSYKKRSANYCYHTYFYHLIKYADRIIMTTPARWLQTTSGELRHLKQLRTSIKENSHLRMIHHYPDFTGNILKNNGGLVYFIYDKDYIGECNINNVLVNVSKMDIILTDGRYINLIKKISKFKYESVNNRFLSPSWAGIKTNDSKISETGKTKIHVSKRKNSKGFQWFDGKYLQYKKPLHFKSWKVLTPETASSSGKGFSNNFIISKPSEIFTETFCGFVVSSEMEAKNLISYFKTDFVNKLISIRKIKNHINKEVLEWVPNVPLDEEWNDEKLFKYFKLTKKERELIN